MAKGRLGVLAVYLSANKLEELSYFRKLCLQGKRYGIEVCVFTPDDEAPEEGTVDALFYNALSRTWVRKRIPIPSLVYDRARYQGAQISAKVKDFRERNSHINYLGKQLANKWIMHGILSDCDKLKRHIPKTCKYSSGKDLSSFLPNQSLLILKPMNGTGGRGVLKLHRISKQEYIVQGRDPQRNILYPRRMTERQITTRLNAWGLSHKYVIQQGIPLTLSDGRVHDYRLLIQKDISGKWDITGCAGRIGPKRSITSNLHGGGVAVPLETLLKRTFSSESKVEKVIGKLNKLGFDTAEYLESKFGQLCELGIDIAVDPSGHPWILEVNPKPSREIFCMIGETETYKKAISRPLEYAGWLMKQKKTKEASS